MAVDQQQVCSRHGEYRGEGCPLCVTDPPLPAPPAWVGNRRLPVPAQHAADAFARLIEDSGDDPAREGLQRTPDRAAKAWLEMMRGYRMRADLTTFPSDGLDEMVTVSRLPFASTCEHHLLPFTGTASFAYLPGGLRVGASKFARLLEVYACRLQMQEQLVQQMADEFETQVKPLGLMFVLDGEHSCMACRGPQVPGHVMTTSVVRGRFKDNPPTRAEALTLFARG